MIPSSNLHHMYAVASSRTSDQSLSWAECLHALRIERRERERDTREERKGGWGDRGGGLREGDYEGGGERKMGERERERERYERGEEGGLGRQRGRIEGRGL